MFLSCPFSLQLAWGSQFSSFSSSLASNRLLSTAIMETIPLLGPSELVRISLSLNSIHNILFPRDFLNFDIQALLYIANRSRSDAFPPAGTTWVACMNAVLNITFLWVPQILFPTFIAEMERPEDFPKSLAVLTGISAILFIVPPAIGFRYLGQYATAPAFGSLGVVAYKKASFAFVIVPTIVIGVIYANVTAKFIYSRILGKSRHAHSNTLLGWGAWVAVMAGIWAIGFVFAEIIPSMGDFLSLLGAAFDSFFGFIYFAVAYWQLYKRNLFAGAGRTLLTIIHVVVLLVGLFLLGPGLYAAVEAIIADYSGETRPAFSCANLAI